jgi:hypothetical protein
MAAYVKKTRLPPGCGDNLNEPYLYNPYIHGDQGFFAALRKRVCLKCKTLGEHDSFGVFLCPKCGVSHTSNLTAPRAFDRLLLLAGRGGGKTLGGAHAVRQELMIPNSHWWAMGPTFKILHDSTFPTLVKLINPDWVADWSEEHMELRLKNGSMVSFRSLEDPERARGPHGLAGGWLDEAAQSPERAYDVFEPTLIKAGGIIIASTTVLGYDWTYDKIEKRALVYKEPGYWSTRWWTEENPLFRSNPVMLRQIEQARKRMEPAFFAQEYKAERRNATGLIYDYSLIEEQSILTADAMKAFIPEWPAIDPSRPVIVGLDSGADHPFGAVMIVATSKGLVVVGEYLERQKAISQHIMPIGMKFGLPRFTNVKWAANKNEINLRLEFGLKSIGVIQAENKHEVGIQRVQSWLYTKQLFFAYTVPTVIEQMRAYRYANNLKPDGSKKPKEAVFKVKDELPDAVRYALMAWPALPEAEEPTRTPREQARWEAMSDETRADVERIKEYEERSKSRDLEDDHPLFPMGEFFNPEGDEYVDS